MTAPSQTPEAAGLEVVAWRSSWTGLTGRVVHALHEKKAEAILNAKWMENAAFEPLVTAASAQARIAELEAIVSKTCDLSVEQTDKLLAMHERATAAVARADRLAKALSDAEETARRYARCYQPESDGRNTFLMLADHIAALQQETQP